MPEGSTKVVTQHREAAEAIDDLRKIARVLKAIGDENVQLKDGNERLVALEAEADQLREKNMALSHEADQLLDWRDLLEDFRRGIVTSEELLERTVGRG